MAWVHQKTPKPKRKDPAETVESTKSLLLFLSGRPPPKSLTKALHKPPPPNEYVEPKPPRRQHHEREHEEEFSSRRYHEEADHHDEAVDAHAFSFSRDRLVPIAPKHPPPPLKVNRDLINRHERTAPRTLTQYSRDPSPPPPPRPRVKPRSTVDSGPKLPRHYVAPDASSRIVSPMWASATTPLRM